MSEPRYEFRVVDKDGCPRWVEPPTRETAVLVLGELNQAGLFGPYHMEESVDDGEWEEVKEG